jgi:hypothetical protein
MVGQPQVSCHRRRRHRHTLSHCLFRLRAGAELIDGERPLAERLSGCPQAFAIGGPQVDPVLSSGAMANGHAPHLVAVVRAGALFVNGKLVERPAGQNQQQAA